MKNTKHTPESQAPALIGICGGIVLACYFLYNGYLAVLILIGMITLAIVFSENQHTASVTRGDNGRNKSENKLNLRNRFFSMAVILSGLLIFCDIKLGYFRILGIGWIVSILPYFYMVSTESTILEFDMRQLPTYLGSQAVILIFSMGLFYLSDPSNSYDFFGMLLILLVVLSFVMQLFSVSLPSAKLSLKKETKMQLATADNGVWAGRVNGKDVYLSKENRAVVIGPPGTGKTGMLVTQALLWAKTKRSFICLDIKPELYGILNPTLQKMGYKVFVYNPTAQAGHRYNPLEDLEGTESVAELASSLISSEDSQNVVFSVNARDFLDAIISHLKVDGVPSLPKVRDFVMRFDTYKDSLIELASSQDKNVVEIAKSLLSASSNERLLGAIFSLFKVSLAFLRHDNVRDSLVKSDFSLAEFCNNEQPVALFLQFSEDHQQTTAGLMSMMVGHILRYLIANTDRDAVLLLLDEIGNAPVISGLLQKLNTIRSRDLPAWLYWQSLEQMQKYGQKHDEGANIIMGAADVKLIFRLNDNKSANWVSEHIGVKDVVLDSLSVSKADGYRTQTASKQLISEPIIRPQELTTLANFETILIYKGQAQHSVATPYFKLWPQFKNRKLNKSEKIGVPYQVQSLETKPEEV
jgi:type IV secretory pathway TraG/TraD family ATPase VirD4